MMIAGRRKLRLSVFASLPPCPTPSQRGWRVCGIGHWCRLAYSQRARIVIKSIEQFIEAIRDGSSGWHDEEPRWFRGEPSCNTPLMPTLYRGGPRRENESLQMFRARGAGYSNSVPHRDHTDQWLFLAQHVGLPTRLLDWSEGALIGLHFALKADDPVVWMLNPLELNDLSVTHPDAKRPREFPLP